MRRKAVVHRRRPETETFRLALGRLREELGLTQASLAERLGVSDRTLSHWESGHWLPPSRQRVHVVLSMRDMPPEYVLEVADGLGVSADPAVTPLLQPFRDALDPPPPILAAPLPVAPPPPPLPPPRAPTDAVALRRTLDGVVRDRADAMNIAANDLRAAVGAALAAAVEIGATLEETRGAVEVRGKTKG